MFDEFMFWFCISGMLIATVAFVYHSEGDTKLGNKIIAFFARKQTCVLSDDFGKKYYTRWHDPEDVPVYPTYNVGCVVLMQDGTVKGKWNSNHYIKTWEFY